MEVPDRVGLLADVMHCLDRNGAGVVNAHIYTTHDGLASNFFAVRDLETGGKVRDEVLEEMREALAARCHLRPRRERSAKKGLRRVRGGRGERRRRERGRERGRGVGFGAAAPGGLFDGPPLGDRSPLVSEYSMDVKMQGMSARTAARFSSG